MDVIRKYPIRGDEFTEHFAVGAKLLKVEVQNGTPMMWVQHTVPTKEVPRVSSEKWELVVLPTGGRVEPDLVHLATYQQPPYVWHLYRRVGHQPADPAVYTAILDVEEAERPNRTDHVCGKQGFGLGTGDVCGACEASRRKGTAVW